MKLLCETNTRAVERRVLRAFRLSAMHVRGRRYVADFEHGQWWITCLRSGAQWSVVDASGGPAIDGFDFERVTEGDEEEAVA